MPGKNAAGPEGGERRTLSRTAFCVSALDGDIVGAKGHGLFHRDTRHLSRLDVLMDGETPGLRSSRVEDGEAMFRLDSGSVPSIVQRRELPEYSGGLIEEIALINDADEARDIVLDLRLDADFADLFEVRGIVPPRRREIDRLMESDALTFSYRRADFHRETRITLESDGDSEVSESGFSVALELPPRAESLVRLRVEVSERSHPLPSGSEARSPLLATDNENLSRLWERSLSDLHSLRFRPERDDASEIYAAGAPWYMALFGRDSLITCYQTLPLGPERTLDTLRLLAKYQGKEIDPFRDEEPGKIPHELRLGEAAHFGETPHSPYYGTADATPLFLIVLHELWRWTGDTEVISGFEGPARRALQWLERCGDSNGSGYIDYTPNPAGLVNQGWKDSDNSLLFANGTMAEPPISLCEVQGYTCDAYLRTAELAQEIWDDSSLARELREKARDLTIRFDQDFWMESRDCYALALDGNGRQVDSVTSNAGHLLWSGIVPKEKAVRLSKTLLSPALFGGWGIRTMASTEGGYDPASYHNGSVWPHDNTLIAQGLVRYGLREGANRIALALLESAHHFDYRLPEVFAGYGRDETDSPVEYPTSCSPQAWAAGSVVLLVRAILGLEPRGRSLTVDPCLPEGVSCLRLSDIPAFGVLHRVEAG